MFKCPHCGNLINGGRFLDVCPVCKNVLSVPKRNLSQASTYTRGSQSAYARSTSARAMPVNVTGNGIKRKKRVSPGRLALTSFALVFILGLLCTGGYYAYRYLLATQVEAPLTVEKAPEVVPHELNGAPGHRITIYGKENDTVFIPELKSSYIVVSGKAVIDVPDKRWIEETPAADAMSVHVRLTPVISSHTAQYALDPIQYEVDVPFSPIELVTPADDELRTTLSIMPLTFRVTPGSIVTLPGKEPSSDLIDSKGYLLYNAAIEPIGDNIITIRVQTPNCRERVYNLVVYREPQDIRLDFSVNLPTFSATNRVTISGYVAPDAAIVVDTPHENLSINTAAGTFSFDAKLDRVGVNTIKVRATAPGKRDSLITCQVEHVPAVDKYSAAAWPFDYQTVLDKRNTQGWQGRIFVLYGKPIEMLSEGSQVIYRFAIDGTEHAVAIDQATSKNKLTLLSNYRIYADLAGEHEGIPLLKLRYVYNN